MKKLICGLLLSTILNSVNAQVYFSVKNVAITNEKLVSCLNDFIELEKKCEYYNRDLILLISYKEVEGIELITLESTEDLNMSLKLNPEGTLEFSGFKIFLYGFENSISTFIDFKKSKTNFPSIKKSDIIVNDDSYSLLQYRIVGDDWSLIKKSSSCY